MVSAIEAAAAAAAILLDLLIPSLVLIAMAVASLLVRRQRITSLGLRRSTGSRLVAKTFLLAVLWSVFQLSVTMPIANHVSGKTQDLSAFNDLQGNAGMLAALLVAGWLLGAFAEELAYRGYLLTRIREALGFGRWGLAVAIVLSSVLFGFAHTEQGLVGVLVVTIDGIYFSVLRVHFQTLWASVLAHGFNNTIGFVAFFLVGPIHGLW
ncbi:CPBP family intramembrane glutamic endopeptidase [Nocardioides panacihumi]|uniref:CPBP family intramembrane glutamic endopeptidase n=1 Tax=Nocardioides panacihumi TaxID=400774 RepID=UPI0031DEB90B